MSCAIKAQNTPKSSHKTRVWQRMLSGCKLDILNPSPKEVESSDLARGLARVARWNGQTRGDEAFSVAQHALFVEAIVANRSNNATRTLKLAALLHDGPEYVIGDLITPFKAVIGDDYVRIERKLLGAIHQKFGIDGCLSHQDHQDIKSADKAAAYFEARWLAGFDEQQARIYFVRPDDHNRLLSACSRHLKPLSASGAEQAFAARLNALDSMRPTQGAPLKVPDKHRE